MSLSKDLQEFIACLNSNRVEYLIVGALAVAWHGFARYSADIDFLVRPTLENAQRVQSAIREFGFGSLDIELTDLTAPNSVIQLGYEPNRIDRKRKSKHTLKQQIAVCYFAIEAVRRPMLRA